MRTARLLVGILYASYLANAGFLLLLLPWGPAWRRAVMTFPTTWSTILDAPAFKGALSGIGVLHLLLLVVELLAAIRDLSNTEG